MDVCNMGISPITYMYMYHSIFMHTHSVIPGVTHPFDNSSYSYTEVMEVLRLYNSTLCY